MNQTSGDLIPFNLSDHFVYGHVREGRAGKVAIRCGESVRTYGDLAADINRAGNGLLRLGLHEEQRVLLLLPDCPEFTVAYFGVIKVGAVAVPTSTFALIADYGYFLSESKARILIVHSMLFSKLAPVLGAQRCLRHVIVVGEPQRGCLHWDEWLSQNSPELEATKTRRTSPFGCGHQEARVGRRPQSTCITTGSAAAGTTGTKW
jgi:benzoate-CoA ligase